MSVALVPPVGNEMDDSMMQEDHPTDIPITIDMESPKHHEPAHQPMVLLDPPGSQGFWPQSLATDTANQLVDIELEPEGTTLEEDGMMSAAEVEMAAAPAYGEEYEYEMSYEAGQPDVNFGVEDTLVHDAELIDAVAHGHEEHAPHAEAPFTSFLHGQPSQPASADPTPHLAVDADAPQAEPPATSLPEPGTTEQDVSKPTSDAKQTEETVPETHEEGTQQVSAEGASEALAGAEDTKSVEKATTQDALAPVNNEVNADGTSTTGIDQAKPPETASVAAEREKIESRSEDQEERAEEPTTELYAAETYEESEGDSKFAAKVPPVILTAFSESSSIPNVLALFDIPDAISVASSSRQASDTPPVLLVHHQYLFLEPITLFLTQLRTELLQAQPSVIPPAEFEYKEIQLVARDLQLVLTEDNIHSREISLFDLDFMHKSCGLPGYLHLDISLQPRFIDRYRAIRHALDAHEKLQLGTENDRAQKNEEARATDLIQKQSILDVIRQDEQPVEGEAIGVNEDGADFEEQPVAGEAVDVNEDGVDLEEPPLPPDDEGASSWSEEQEEGAIEGDHALPVGDVEENEWEDAYKPDTAAHIAPIASGQAVTEEFIHEDEYVPGDEPVVAEQGDDTYDDDKYPADNEEYLDSQGDELDNSNQGGDQPTDERTEPHLQLSPSPHNKLSLNDNEANTSQVVDAINDHAPETDGFVDDNEEWNEQEYGKTALEGDDEAAGETQLENATDDEHKNEVDEPDVSASLQGAEEMPKGYTPVRKRSFNEVEEEPEGQSTQSPNSKKPRHS